MPLKFPRMPKNVTTSAASELLARLEKLHPKLIDLSLDRMLRLLKALGDPQDALPPVIHLAGTNGKGSVAAFLKAILEAAGYRTHVFISPHLRSFHERIALASPRGAQPISDAALADVLRRTEAANAGQPITFFEITTAAAFLAFAETPADVVILETGLGGRLDATNVVKSPLMTVITPVSLDHCNFLGDTIEQIAFEKAGIIKPGRPIVVSRQTSEAYGVIASRAREQRAPFSAAQSAWDAFEQHGRLVFQDSDTLLDLPLPRLFGRHQIDNAGTAIAAARRLKGFRIADEHLARGVTTATWPARLERLAPGALHELAAPGSEIWVDGGHNPAAGEVVARALADLEERVSCPIHLIVGMLETKDAGGFLQHFHGLTALATTVAIPGHNAYSAYDLAQLARDQGISAQPAENLEEAFLQSRNASHGPVRIMVTGSLYLAGQVLEAHEHGFARI